MGFEKRTHLFETATQSEAQLIEDIRNLEPEIINETEIFNTLENMLNAEGLQLATTPEVVKIFNETDIICRNESLTQTLKLIHTHTPITILNRNKHANMCRISFGNGFRVAMSEGFSGKEVGGKMNVVISFRDTNLVTKTNILPTDSLWELKPNTAKVSIVGSGIISFDDIQMVSFKFPVHLFPSRLLTVDEVDLLDEEKIHSIVRHYIRKDTKKPHTIH